MSSVAGVRSWELKSKNLGTLSLRHLRDKQVELFSRQWIH